jgi:NADH:ubiquinone reductase (H+-translocating)
MKLVIIGGGFGGLKLARSLNNKPGFDITLIDKFNYHQFQPLFYQVATAGLDASNISFPLRKAFHGSRNVHIRLAEVQEIVHAENKIITDIGEIEYDILVIATGADTNFFGNTRLIENAFPMKSTVEALQIRHRLIQNFEDALAVTDEAQIEQLLTVVIVGGGPTGVEMAGAIAEMKNYVLPKDYPELDFKKMKIYLLEGGPKTLEVMGPKSAAQSQKYLQRLGVTVLVNTKLQDYDGGTITLNNGTLRSCTVIWAAGVRGNVPKGIQPELVARGNRIRVDRYNRVKGFENIYAIGDVAYMETPTYPNSHPQVAPVAMQQAKLLAKNLMKIERKSPRQVEEFEYHDKGVMATVGKNLAVVDIPKPRLHFGGIFAWFIWMFLHLVLILGVKNRFFVLINWMTNYFTNDPSLRLIFKQFNKPRRAVEVAKMKI